MQINNENLKVAYIEFQERLTEVKRYIKFVNALETQYFDDELIVLEKEDVMIDIESALLGLNLRDTKDDIRVLHHKINDNHYAYIDRELLQTLKASSYLLLYNLLESTMAEAINAIHETIKDEGHQITDLSSQIHKIILASFQKALSADKIDAMFKNNQDVRDELLTMGHNKRNLFSGNIDADVITKFCKKYGFEPYPCDDEQGNKKKYDTKIIREIRTKRNNLAHGSESFEQCGRSIVYGSLLEKLSSTEAILLAVFQGITKFLDDKKYLRTPPQQTQANNFP